MTVNEQGWYIDVGRRLRAERVRRGWTLYDVAAVLGCSHVAVSKWERAMQRMKAFEYDRLQREGLLG